MSTCTHWVDKFVIECKQWADRLAATCQDWGTRTREACTQYGQQSYEACDRYEDHGYSTCSSWSESCKDWLPWPLSYICDAFELVCDAWVWISHWVCVAWVWVTKWICIAWATIVEAFCVAWLWLIEAVCIVSSWVLKPVCIAWDWVRCTLVAIGRGLGALLFGWRKNKAARIRHVFVLMMENRSFDHMLGFSDISGVDAFTGQPRHVDDLIGKTVSNTDIDFGTVAPQPIAPFFLTTEQGDPGHEFDNVVRQLAGKYAKYIPGLPYPTVTNTGYLADFVARGSSDPGQTMHGFTRDKVPIIDTLAREFAVCDAWFSSVPGPTWPNRLFVHAGSSAGLDDSPGDWDTVSTTLIDGYRFDNGTVFDRLDDKCRKWMVYHGDELPQVFALSGMTYNRAIGRFEDFDDFASAVAKKSYPPSYTFIEPHYGNIMPWTPGDYTCGTSQHPLDDVTRGEALIKQVYEAVRNSPHWNSSLIILTYDENGGFYDHATPPAAVPPGDSVTDNENNHKNFDFSQLGARVPAVIISPLIPRGVIDNRVHDHTSVVKTLCEIFRMPSLTDRDRAANSLLPLLSLATPRTDAPTRLPAVPVSGFRCEGDPDQPTPDGGVILRTRPADEELAKTEAALRAQKPESSLRGWMHVAFRRWRDRAGTFERIWLKRRFKRIESSYDARVFIGEAREAIQKRTRRKRRRRARRAAAKSA